MLIEIHMLQNHVPANINRDDTGSPKDCLFGGIRRARISSQCLKRSIRRSPIFQEVLAANGGAAFRTRQLPALVKDRLLEKGLAADVAEAAAKKATGFGNKEGTERDDFATAQTIFLTNDDVQAVADVIFAALSGKSAKEIEKLKGEALKELQKETARVARKVTPDLALFGRMVTSDAFMDVDGALQVAHAISTNRLEQEFDYFTAVDDLPKVNDEGGADMIGDVEYNASCFYKYFSIHVEGVMENFLGVDLRKANNTHAAQARNTAAAVTGAFIEAAAFTVPSGKKNSFANNQLPEAVLVEIRDRNIPVSYANAFVKPAEPTRSADLVSTSVDMFTRHVTKIDEKYGIRPVHRYWFSVSDAALSGASDCENFAVLVEAVRQAVLQG